MVQKPGDSLRAAILGEDGPSPERILQAWVAAGWLRSSAKITELAPNYDSYVQRVQGRECMALYSRLAKEGIDIGELFECLGGVAAWCVLWQAYRNAGPTIKKARHDLENLRKSYQSLDQRIRGDRALSPALKAAWEREWRSIKMGLSVLREVAIPKGIQQAKQFFSVGPIR